MRIVSIKKIEKEETYDLNIEGNHNYFVGQGEISVHNSGKDATKVDRSAAYMARKIAVDLLKLYGGNEVLVKLSYAIGYPQPIQATASINGMVDMTLDQYDLSPNGIIKELDLKKPIFHETSMWGHMGSGFKWG
jgi:S-adenosylmethionine synthetase